MSFKRKALFFRENSDHGIWCSLLIPFAIGVSNFKHSNGDFSTFLLATFLGIFSLYSAFKICKGETVKENELRNNFRIIKVFFIVASVIVQSYNWLPTYKIIINTICLAGYISHLPHMFVTFPKSFTFGEGCLVLQSLVLFVSQSDALLLSQVEDSPSIARKVAQNNVTLLAFASVLNNP
jgi:hypothetical protein